LANYSKATNFTVKDSLQTGNANKVVRGSEIDNEFIAISSAIASKADINSPTFTGVPAAPTAITGTNTTQLATTAFVKNAIIDLDLGTMSIQDANAVAIVGGTISGLSTPLPVASGGTSSNTLAANNVLLGNGTSALQTVAPGNIRNLLTSTGTTWVSQAPSYVGNQAQIFTSNGTFTLPVGVTALKITVVGGGGGAGGGTLTPSDIPGGSAGGGGTAIKYLTGLTPGNTLAVTVGAAGAGGTTNNNGTSGGSSTVASGTETITTITGGGGGAGNTVAAAGFGTPGTGGSGTNGTYNISGGSPAVAGLVTGGSGYIAFSPAGGNSTLGDGGGAQMQGAVYTGRSAIGYGGGGSGTYYSGFQAGNGSAGIVIIEW
jgi:hypothetical protein